MNGQVYPGDCAHGQGGLTSAVIGNELGRNGSFIQILLAVDTRNEARRVSVFVAVPIPWLPPGGVVAGHGKFADFFHYTEIPTLAWFAQQAVAEPNAVIKNPESDFQLPRSIFEHNL